MAAELTQERLREVLRYFPSLGLWRWRTSKGGRAVRRHGGERHGPMGGVRSELTARATSQAG